MHGVYLRPIHELSKDNKWRSIFQFLHFTASSPIRLHPNTGITGNPLKKDRPLRKVRREVNSKKAKDIASDQSILSQALIPISLLGGIHSLAHSILLSAR